MTISERAQSRRDRLSRFTFSVNVRSDNPLTSNIHKHTSEISAENKHKSAKDLSKLAIAISDSYDFNGPDIYVDRYLRTFLSEYNNRVLHGRGANMPTSFNVCSAFVEPDERTLILKLLPERFYNISFGKMLDHITDPKNELTFENVSELTEELIIYEFNALGGFSKFELPGHEEYVFCGLAFVREGTEISIITVLGKSGRDGTANIVDADPTYIAPEKEFILDGVDEINLTRQPLFGDEKFSPIILLTRVDAKNGTVQVRYALEETIDTFRIITDDPQTIEHARKMGRWSKITEQKSLEEFKNYIPLFDITISLLSCIAFNDADELVVERHPTQFRIDKNNKVARNARSKLGISEVPNYVNVSTLFDSDTAKESFNIPASSLKMESSGYWKTLPLSVSGRDRNGQVIQGKTWVTTKESWFEEHIEKYDVERSPVRVDLVGDDSVGEVYVMRSAQHEKDVYKIGFTTKSSDERAQQLGSTSGQPDMFNVVESWNVRVPRQIEQQVHKILAEYRINQKREFFKVKYARIHETIERIIREGNLALPDQET